ncbi:MAG: hypothetical protein A3D24_03340 [Candidatus Blackburnbacteria bacterium RIFCSPHIGHO2_02_FULL_39_13]|uniref:Uncharacterized protein n=1 Tax=Candidatus Blackburnbacteria bacterium RIFCSPLOWO2_01_FULL_40_20 TaxID=1797519 RepID=A0A1G1VFK5_9BACT|nr:MAG: hypothetical protein A2694_04640 [Candidatus Blackburnbacteria bacterium RIFCSPHIGHO2_01_FULL_40_17]OGY08858.1 MAG: hypothetical protein A3D24_03340 [Candidatus Blackburnbacteria bacterium RIFCSPHIGHO2_02_FULL_39_13]OGY14233.1 MAG: hypothetical protein A3A77_02030 [Candidatus Blackburnbacteria bacterium RIFCSPLOWO2_01_FULL_40_20]HBL51969.1 hypothetical protein [Candidatus Blackburnbacteria bacterium]
MEEAMKHISGGKVNRSHTTVIDAAEKFVKAAQKLPEVNKISLGPIKMGLPAGDYNVKFIPIVGGVQAKVRGPRSIQVVFLYTKNPDMVERALASVFSR